MVKKDMGLGAANGPLRGIRVTDFSVHAAGPFAGEMLAEMGADAQIRIACRIRTGFTRSILERGNGESSL